VEATANVVGAALVAGSLGFVAVHGAATVLSKHQARKAESEPVPLAILGDKEEEKKSDGRGKEG
jgi:hydrogenase small subunit